MADLENFLKEIITTVPDFPKEGILFYDITPLMRDVEAFSKITDSFAERYSSMNIDTIVGIDARGFIFGSALAYAMKLPFVPLRKAGKLPPEVDKVEYTLEYGVDSLEIKTDAIGDGHRTVIIDDLLATGGTAQGAIELIEKRKGVVVECSFVVELNFLEGRQKLNPVPVNSLIRYDS